MASRPNALRLALHVMDQWATRVIEGSPSAYDLAISSSLTDALDFLPGWYDDWALMERERIRQRLLHALEAVSRRLARAGDYAGAVEAAMLAISAEPLRESAQSPDRGACRRGEPGRSAPWLCAIPGSAPP